MTNKQYSNHSERFPGKYLSLSQMESRILFFIFLTKYDFLKTKLNEDRIVVWFVPFYVIGNDNSKIMYFLSLFIFRWWIWWNEMRMWWVFYCGIARCSLVTVFLKPNKREVITSFLSQRWEGVPLWILLGLWSALSSSKYVFRYIIKIFNCKF